jgi:hypothetical protein
VAHSRFAPSATEREYNCPASFLLNEQLPDRQTDDAAHGTAAHHVAEKCLAYNHDMIVYAGCTIAVTEHGECRFVHEKAPVRDDERAFEVDDEMVNAVQEYVDWCREAPGDHFTEIRVEHTKWCPDKDEWGDQLGPQFGTADHIAIYDATTEELGRHDVLEVTDLKYGKGVKVYAKENKQAIKYALGALDEYGWMYNTKRVRIRIAQPRLDHFDTWELSVEELLEWGEKIKKRLELVFVDNPPFGPTEKGCKFCKAAAKCVALADYIHESRACHFDDETVDVKLLPVEALVEAWKKRDLVKLRYDAIEKELYATLWHGQTAPGLKMVAGRGGNRTWRDEDEAVSELRKLGIPPDKLYKSTLISPNQAEELLPREERDKISGLYIKPPGKPCIVDADDPREPYTATADGFDDEDDGFDS